MTSVLLAEHDVVLLDLDGTVYRGAELVERAADAVAELHRNGVLIRYVTNNASKPAGEVAQHLDGLGLPAASVEISTSAQAGVAVLAEELPAAAVVLVVGSEALAAEVARVGLTPARKNDDGPVAVVQGHSPATCWGDLAEACLALRQGALWVACNADVTLPAERGLLPGNGAMVAALRAATGREPIIAGKPQRPLLEAAVSSAGGNFPLLVGDRLDTDIEGAVRAGIPGLLVLTGVSSAAELLAATPERQPTYVAADLSALSEPGVESLISEQAGWTVWVDGTALVLQAVADRADPLPALRALCAFRWSLGSGPIDVRAFDPNAAEALRKLGLG